MTYQPPPPPADTVIATFSAAEQAARRLADSFADTFDGGAVSLVDAGQGQWRVTFYFRSAIDEGGVRDMAIAAAGAQAGTALRFEHIAPRDWVGESLLGLKPIKVGRFVVHGSHDRSCAPANRIGIEIEAAQAFGTGHHGTTLGCLLALDWLCKPVNSTRRKRMAPSPCKGEGRGGGHLGGRSTPIWLAFARRPPPFRGKNSLARILDLGTGSGVLAIAAARSLRRCVLATDIDPLAVRIARDNARLNRSGRLLRVCRIAGLAGADIRAGAPFDLVFANILLTPLQKLAAPLTRLVAPRGRVILSGLLNTQANAARAAYRHFFLERRIAIDGWATLVLRRSAAPPFAASKK
jgi:ribosomal protein L11 methyltransferase